MGLRTCRSFIMPERISFYLRLDDRKQQVINNRLSDDIVLDLGKDNRIVGIEILDASKHLNLERLFPGEIRSFA